MGPLQVLSRVGFWEGCRDLSAISTIPCTKLKNRGKKKETNLSVAGPGIKISFGFVCFMQHFLLTLKIKLKRELIVPVDDGGNSGNHT